MTQKMPKKSIISGISTSFDNDFAVHLYIGPKKHSHFSESSIYRLKLTALFCGEPIYRRWLTFLHNAEKAIYRRFVFW